MDSLNCDARFDIMDNLNKFYTHRKTMVDTDMCELEDIDEKFQERENDTKNSMQTMLSAFEDKQMKEVKVLVKCTNTLNLGAAGKLKKKQRKRFAAEALAALPGR